MSKKVIYNSPAKSRKVKSYAQISIFLLVATILIVVAGFRPIGFDRDSFNYADSFFGFSRLVDANFLEKEPTFWIITALTDFLSENNIRLFFVIYAALGILTITFSILKISKYPFAALVCYILLYFPLHGMTQIRAGVAASIFLLSIPNIVERRLGSYFIKIVLAIMFHYVSVVLLGFYLLDPKRINKIFYGCLPIIGLASSIFSEKISAGLDILTSLLPDFINYKMAIYRNLLEKGVGEDINLFSIYYVGLLTLYYFGILNIGKLHGRYDYILIKLLGWALFSYYFFSFIPAVSVRVSELIGIVIVIIIPILASSVKPKIFSFGAASFFLIFTFVNNVFMHQLFNI